MAVGVGEEKEENQQENKETRDERVSRRRHLEKAVTTIHVSLSPWDTSYRLLLLSLSLSLSRFFSFHETFKLYVHGFVLPSRNKILPISKRDSPKGTVCKLYLKFASDLRVRRRVSDENL